MNNNFYTELTYTHKCIEDHGPTTITIKKTAWDLPGDQLLEMFHGIFIGATYAEESFQEVLAGYLESCDWTVIRPKTEGDAEE